jgi:hypothetical protein
MAKATVDGLKRLRRPEDVARSRGKSIMEVLPLPRKPRVGEEPAAEAPAPVEPAAEAPAEAAEPEAIES